MPLPLLWNGAEKDPDTDMQKMCKKQKVHLKVLILLKFAFKCLQSELHPFLTEDQMKRLEEFPKHIKHRKKDTIKDTDQSKDRKDY